MARSLPEHSFYYTHTRRINVQITLLAPLTRHMKNAVYISQNHKCVHGKERGLRAKEMPLYMDIIDPPNQRNVTGR